MRSVVAALVAAVAATLAGVAALYAVSPLLDAAAPSADDVMGFAVLAFVSTVLLALGLYAPAVTYGRRRWQWSRSTSLLIASFVLNVPVWIVLLIGWWNGMYGGISEVALFATSYVTGGLVYGLAS